MTSRYLFEVSPERPIESDEPLDIARSFYLDLTLDQLEGIYFMGRALEGPQHIRIYQENLVTHGWDPYDFPPSDELPSQNWLGDMDVEIHPEDTPGEIFRELEDSIVFRNRRLPRNQAYPVRRYYYVLEYGIRPRVHHMFFSSNTLGTFQGMISVANWLGIDWRQYVKYIFEYGRPMRVV